MVFVVVRGDLRLEFCPRHELLHLREDVFATGQLALGVVFSISEGQLRGHRRRDPGRTVCGLDVTSQGPSVLGIFAAAP